MKERELGFGKVLLEGDAQKMTFFVSFVSNWAIRKERGGGERGATLRILGDFASFANGISSTPPYPKTPPPKFFRRGKKTLPDFSKWRRLHLKTRKKIFFFPGVSFVPPLKSQKMEKNDILFAQ